MKQQFQFFLISGFSGRKKTGFGS